MRKLHTLVALGLVFATAAPALAQNQFPDPYLLDPAGVSVSASSGISYSLPTLTFVNGAAADLYSTAGSVNTALLAAWPASETRNVSVNVLTYANGSWRCRFRNGSFVDLNLSGTGPSTPVSITAGTSGFGLLCTPASPGNVNFSLRGDASNGLITITP